jgi:hypothetical protein
MQGAKNRKREANEEGKTVMRLLKDLQVVMLKFNVPVPRGARKNVKEYWIDCSYNHGTTMTENWPRQDYKVHI